MKEWYTFAAEKLLDTLPEDLRSDFEFLFNKKEEDEALWEIIKAADKISALIKCIEERKAGNIEFSKAEQSTLDSIKEMNLSEADDFIKEFLPGFELTLDQLT